MKNFCLAITIAVVALGTAPTAHADTTLVMVVADIVDFKYWRGDPNCLGAGQKEGYNTSEPVALRGFNTNEVSLGMAEETSSFILGQAPMCTLTAYVEVENLDDEYWIKWGDRDWEPRSFRAIPNPLDGPPPPGSEKDYVLVSDFVTY